MLKTARWRYQNENTTHLADNALTRHVTNATGQGVELDKADEAWRRQGNPSRQDSATNLADKARLDKAQGKTEVRHTYLAMGTVAAV